MEAEGGFALKRGDVHGAAVIHRQGPLAERTFGRRTRRARRTAHHAPAVRDAETKEHLLGWVAGGEVEVGNEFAVGEPGLHFDEDGAEGGG